MSMYTCNIDIQQEEGESGGGGGGGSSRDGSDKAAASSPKDPIPETKTCPPSMHSATQQVCYRNRPAPL